MIAIIPARGGSKGLPKKNILEFNGKPLIAHTIMEALSSKYIDKVFVSTDSEEIANISKKFGALVPFLRPDYLATDTATTYDVLIYTIDRLNEEFKENIEDFILLQPTSPLRTAEDINKSIELYISNNAYSVSSFSEVKHPIEWIRYKDKDGKILSSEFSSQLNRQSFSKKYMPNGAIYIFNINNLENSSNYYAENSYMYVMDEISSIDIDDINDFKIAEFIHKNRKEFLK